MGSNEIRLRRSSAGVGKSKRHQNYNALMRKHNRYLKLRRTLYILYIVVFVFLFILLFMLVRVQKNKEQKSKAVETSFTRSVNK